MDPQNIIGYVETLLAEARGQQQRFQSDPINWGSLCCPINWGSLCCASVVTGQEHYTTGRSEEVTLVFIEEASPSCDELPRWIREELKSRWGIDAEVRTEW